MPEQPPQFICELCGGAHLTSEHSISGNDSKADQNMSAKAQNEPTAIITYDRLKAARAKRQEQKLRQELERIIPQQRAAYHAKTQALSEFAHKYGYDYDSVEGHIEELVDEREAELEILRRKNPFAESSRQRDLLYALKELRDDLKRCHEAYEGYRELEQVLAANEQELENT